MGTGLKLLQIIKSYKEYLASVSNLQECFIVDGDSNAASLHSTAVWNDAVCEETLDRFLTDNSWEIPDDYREFLLLHNGCNLFTHPEARGGISLLDLDWIIGVWKDFDLPKTWIPIALTSGVTGSICIDTEKLNGNIFPYMFFLDAMDQVEDAIPIHCDFTTWFGRLLTVQGDEFWLWDKYDKIKFK